MRYRRRRRSYSSYPRRRRSGGRVKMYGSSRRIRRSPRFGVSRTGTRI